jgi:hypothetical protein
MKTNHIIHHPFYHPSERNMNIFISYNYPWKLKKLNFLFYKNPILIIFNDNCNLYNQEEFL